MATQYVLWKNGAVVYNLVAENPTRLKELYNDLLGNMYSIIGNNTELAINSTSNAVYVEIRRV